MNTQIQKLIKDRITGAGAIRKDTCQTREKDKIQKTMDTVRTVIFRYEEHLVRELDN